MYSSKQLDEAMSHYNENARLLHSNDFKLQNYILCRYMEHPDLSLECRTKGRQSFDQFERDYCSRRDHHAKSEGSQTMPSARRSQEEESGGSECKRRRTSSARQVEGTAPAKEGAAASDAPGKGKCVGSIYDNVY
jgi:hypothetical protein